MPSQNTTSHVLKSNVPQIRRLIFAALLCLVWSGAARGAAIMSDADFFGLLDYRLPYLTRVKDAVEHGDYAGAKVELLAAMRKRRTRQFCVDWMEWDGPPTTLNWWQKPNKPDPSYNRTIADKVCAHIFTGEAVGRYPDYQMGPKIDWAADPYHYREWTVQLNRHTSWLYLGTAYWATGDEKYARAFNEQIQDWITNMPVVTDGTHNSSAAWRTIEAGIRMFESWPACYQFFLQSPSFTPEAHCLMMKSMVDHARHLIAHPRSGNWLLMESYGLVCVGTMYPEFSAAEKWRQTGMNRLEHELTNQVYPDGFQKELSTSYHMVSVVSFTGAYQLERLNHLPIPNDYMRDLERMYDAILRMIKPSGFLPPANDSYSPVEGISPADHLEAILYLARGAELFGRKDMEFVATFGRHGKRPSELSYEFPYAGFAVMRSDWTRDARYLMFDAGPYGLGHQHEDKLHVDVYAYGKTLLYDTGLYEYDGSAFQRYVRSSAGHNTALVDGLGQNRRASGVPTTIKQPLGNPWVSTSDFDYTAGTYDEGYGPKNDRAVTHHRQIMFIKPNYWVILDDFPGSAGHKVEFHWHLRPGLYELNDRSLVCSTINPGEANLIVEPSSTEGLDARVAVGSENPVEGWITSVPGIDGPGGKVAAPEAVYTWRGNSTLSLAWLLYPSRGVPVGKPAITAIPLPGANLGQALLRIDLPDGKVDYVLMARGLSGPKHFAGRDTAADMAVMHVKQP